jgi:hypothetical protein
MLCISSALSSLAGSASAKLACVAYKTMTHAEIVFNLAPANCVVLDL